MAGRAPPGPPVAGADAQRALQIVFQGTASETGERFFQALVENLAKALGTRGAWVTELLPSERRLRALAFWLGGQWVQNYETGIDGTPCRRVVEERRVVHLADRLFELFPEDPSIQRVGAVSYLGVPLMDLDGTILGHLAVMDTKPMPAEPLGLKLFEIFAARAAAELRRLRAEAEVRARQAELARLVDETEYLRGELRELGNSGEIVGRSDALARVLAELRQVAPADTTVLLLGETGTGKELFARALHEASRRRGKPLIKVNCAAVPAALIESEFFGHERGAFTGATSKRDGRFTLADGGTLFLDEVGELPLELQGKLLRVLQEGEFEPVGSSRTRKVDVRVVAATNRDLSKALAEGRFREDLYYRLNVFPLTLPPLRERGDDVLLLAERFARQFAARAGRQLAPLSAEAAARLRSYAWPGNVRELQNVIERAVITASNGQLNWERALPAPAVLEPSERPSPGGIRVLTAQELATLERDNMLRALESTGWQIAGDSGAARLLGMAPSTLASRMKALGLRREG